MITEPFILPLWQLIPSIWLMGEMQRTNSVVCTMAVNKSLIYTQQFYSYITSIYIVIIFYTIYLLYFEI